MEQPDLFEGDPEATRSILAQLLENSRLYETSNDYKELLNFIVKLRNFAPFNAMLLHIQKPGLMYAASAHDWLTRFNRTINEGARPLLILWPFGPVAFVYDLQDTEGKDPLPADIAQTFCATGSITADEIQKFIHPLSRRGIDLKFIEYGDGSAGHIKVIRRSDNAKEKPEYHIRINSIHDPNVQFATLIHELGHLYLGHFGRDKFLNIPIRPSMNHQQSELEAESFSYIICSRNNVQSKSESYLKDYVQKNTTIENFDIYVMLKAAGQVETALGLAAHIQLGQAK